MKKYFFLGMAAILILAISIVAYGAYLNHRGENQIVERMAGSILQLRGAKAAMRGIYPVISLETINLYSKDLTDAVALIDGRITEELVDKNSNVVQGQAICMIVNENIPLQIKQADSSILKAQADLARARNSYHRYNSLWDLDATSAEKRDEVEADYYAAVANLEDKQAQKEQLLIQEARQEVTAPIDGEILILYRQIGSYVTAGTSIALIGNFRALFFSLPMEDEMIRRLALGDEAELLFNRKDFPKIYDTQYAAGNAGGDQKFTVSLADISPPLDEEAAMRKILWRVDNSSGLLEPQTYSGVKIQSAMPYHCLAVPISAMADASRNRVFVLTEQGTLEERYVSTGVDDGYHIEILSGLGEGEIVVTSGTNGLESGMRAEIRLEEED